MTTPTNQTNGTWQDEFDSIFGKLFSQDQINKYELPKDHPQYGVMVAYPQNEKIKSFIQNILKDALASQKERHKEIVICAAVIEEDGTIIRGHRHSDCFAAIQNRGKKAIKRDDGLTQQGFVTSRNRFVDRKEAMKIQKAAGIQSADPEGYRGSELYSEDLY